MLSLVRTPDKHFQCISVVMQKLEASELREGHQSTVNRAVQRFHIYARLLMACQQVHAHAEHRDLIDAHDRQTAK